LKKPIERKSITIACFLFVATSLLAPLASATGTTTFSGRAFALYIQTPVAGTMTVADTGQLPSSGGDIDATLLSVQTSVATANVLLATTMGFDSTAESQAAIADLTLLPGNPNQITADFLLSESIATCTGVSGFSDITNLQLAGQKITVSTQPNQVVSVPGILTLVINEQKATANSITVNALHLTTTNGIEVIVSSASSDISCPPSPPPPPTAKDFVTGGGWIPVSNGKATFGLVAGFKPHATSPSVNMVYHDHSTGKDVRATSINSYSAPSSNTRTFSGIATVNGQQAIPYTVTVVDNGEPGAGHDQFSIQLQGGSNGYSASSILGGGNLEIHT
jgi:hypothetical protein